MHFVKVFDTIADSSISEEELHVRWMWIVMLIACDREGIVRGTIQALARKANIDLEQADEAMEILTAKDPTSSTQDEEGRRVLAVAPNMWFVVNYLKYRGMKDPSEERAKTRERVAKHRAKKKEEAGNAGNKNVTESNDMVEVDGDVEVEGERDTGENTLRLVGGTNKSEGKEKARTLFLPPLIDEVQSYINDKSYHFNPEDFIDFYKSKGWMVGKNKMKDWKAACRTWERRWKDEHPEGGGDYFQEELKKMEEAERGRVKPQP